MVWVDVCVIVCPTLLLLLFFQNILKKYWHKYTAINAETIQKDQNSPDTGDVAARIPASSVRLLNIGGTPQK